MAVFLSSFLGSATFLVPVIPIPSYIPITLGIGVGLNPLIVGLLASFGSVLGDIIGYFIGLGSETTLEKIKGKTPRFVKKFERFYSKIGFRVILIFSFLPFPFDIIGVLSGASKYNFKKFLLALTIGRLIRSLIIVYTISFMMLRIVNLF